MNLKYKKLEGYQFKGSIGKGGQGEVIKVSDPTGRRTYALKLLNRSLDLSVLKKEIETLQILNHSNIVQIYDSGFNKEEGGYILMEYMRHGNLTNYLAQHKESSLFERLLLIKDAAQALEYIYDQGFIHRDIKPHNIFVTDDGNGVYACLGDFGIAKKIDKHITSSTGGKGSYSYLPLEVLTGEEKHSKQSDLYGLGMSMYEIFSGKHPVDNFIKYVQELSNPEPFMPPSYYDKSIGTDIDELCLRAIAKKKEERFQTIEELHNQLNLCIDRYNSKLHKDTEEEKKQEIIKIQNKYQKNEIDIPSSIEREAENVSDRKNILLTHEVKNTPASISIVEETNIDTTSAKDLYSMGKNYFYGLNNCIQNKEKGIEYIEQAAKKGHISAMIDLGDLYRVGDRVDRDYAKAVKWFTKSAKAGNADGMNNLGFMYQQGLGVDRDYRKAIKWYTKSAEIGNSAGINNLGQMYQQGLGVDRDYTEAVKWYTKSAEIGNSAGMNNLGEMYRQGLGVDRDYREAIKWYTKSAEVGNSAGMNNLGLMYRRGLGVKQDNGEAVKWFKESAETGESNGMGNLGYMYEKGLGVERNYAEAVKWYTKSAEAGNAYAMYNLGGMYREGLGVDRDYSKALKWITNSAEAGDSDGMNHLGRMYEKGLNRDYTKAIKWYTKSAEAGDSSGMNHLGQMYEKGLGVDLDYAEAVKWYRRSAGLGNSNGMFNLGGMYADARGVEQDNREAMELFIRSAEAGNSSAIVYLITIYENGMGDIQANLAKADYYRKQLKQLRNN